MKVTIPTQVLLDAAGHGASVAATRSPKPVLECLAIHASPESGVVLEATDLDVGIRLHLADATVEEAGTLVIPAARLLSILREVDDDQVILVGDDGNLIIETGRSHFRVRGEDVEGLADFPDFPEEPALTIPGDVLRSMIRRTSFAAAKEAGRYALHGVLVRIAGGQLEFVATDGRRLARATRELPEAGERELKVIVGTKGLSLLDRVLGTQPCDVSIALEERQVLFQVDDAFVISRLVDGTFPAYEDVIPAPSERSFSLQVSDFGDALRKVALLTSRDALSVQFDIEPEMLTIRSRAPELGEARVAVPIEYDGPSERLGFNPGFLSDALKVLDAATDVRFEFSNSKAPGKLTDSDDYAYVIMPLALE